MTIDKILQCPVCKKSVPTIMRQESDKNENKFLYCASCLKKFHRDEENSFFQFFEKECKSKGTFMTESEVNFYTNQKFKELCVNYLNSNLKQALKKYGKKIIVDVGCGNGKYAYNLNGLYCRYYGLEPFRISRNLAIDSSRLPENAMLLQYDTTEGLPIRDNSADIITFLASYDHVPNVKNTINNVYKKLKKDGYLLVLCSNYNFWVKQSINHLLGKKMFQHQNIHFNVYSPASLIKEVKSFSDFKVECVKADFFFLPNLPKEINFIYFSKKLMIFINFLLKYFLKMLSVKNAGSGMIVVFKK